MTSYQYSLKMNDNVLKATRNKNHNNHKTAWSYGTNSSRTAACIVTKYAAAPLPSMMWFLKSVFVTSCEYGIKHVNMGRWGYGRGSRWARLQSSSCTTCLHRQPVAVDRVVSRSPAAYDPQRIGESSSASNNFPVHQCVWCVFGCRWQRSRPVDHRVWSRVDQKSAQVYILRSVKHR